MPEHPHRRGENAASGDDELVDFGTSPQAWGKPGRRAADRPRRRNIPTGVGKTAPPISGRHPVPEHPHRRGENSMSRRIMASASGTSPQAWGKHHLARRAPGEARNIPTGVGKTPSSPYGSDRAPEHPHRRGENAEIGTHRDENRGTSPQAWGKLAAGLLAADNARNIPTGVGKTRSRRRTWGPRAEHPHRRGENGEADRTYRAASGTSPQAWGKLRRITGYLVGTRNIPTGVGKTTM